MQEKAPAAARHFFVRGQNKRRVVDARYYRYKTEMQ